MRGANFGSLLSWSRHAAGAIGKRVGDGDKLGVLVRREGVGDGARAAPAAADQADADGIVNASVNRSGHCEGAQRRSAGRGGGLEERAARCGRSLYDRLGHGSRLLDKCGVLHAGVGIALFDAIVLFLHLAIRGALGAAKAHAGRMRSIVGGFCAWRCEDMRFVRCQWSVVRGRVQGSGFRKRNACIVLWILAAPGAAVGCFFAIRDFIRLYSISFRLSRMLFGPRICPNGGPFPPARGGYHAKGAKDAKGQNFGGKEVSPRRAQRTRRGKDHGFHG